jgi:acyl-CoA synthetase (AMP-forming)/AMP-acid ligase II
MPPISVGVLEIDSPQRVKQLPEGWVRTSDLARIDEDGFLYIVGRADDVIIRGGFKVALTEVEQMLEKHPAVAAAQVIGVEDSRLGSVPQAIIVQRAGHGIVPGDLLAWLKDRLSPYMVPTRILIVDQLPLNGMMKKDPQRAAQLLNEESDG